MGKQYWLLELTIEITRDILSLNIGVIQKREREEMIASEKKKGKKKEVYIYKIYMWNGVRYYISMRIIVERERERCSEWCGVVVGVGGRQ